MKKDLFYILAATLFLSAGTYLNQKSNRAPASFDQVSSKQDLGLINTRENHSARSHSDSSQPLSVPTIEKRRNMNNTDVKAVEESLTRKMANDQRYVAIFNLEDMNRISACSIGKAQSQIGIEQFKKEISENGSTGNHIFLHCAVTVHAARMAYARAHNIAPKKKNSLGSKTGNTAVAQNTEAEANAEALVAASEASSTTESVDTSSCNTETGFCPIEGSPDFVGPPRPSQDTSTGSGATSDSSGATESNPFGNGLGI